jgi:hypothetical protein
MSFRENSRVVIPLNSLFQKQVVSKVGLLPIRSLVHLNLLIRLELPLNSFQSAPDFRSQICFWYTFTCSNKFWNTNERYPPKFRLSKTLFSFDVGINIEMCRKKEVFYGLYEQSDYTHVSIQYQGLNLRTITL